MTYREFCTQIVPMVNDSRKNAGKWSRKSSGNSVRSLWKHLLSDQKSAETLWKQCWI